MNFQNRLVELRNHTKNSQQKVATSLGIAQSTYNNYEQGNSEPSIERLIELADFYNVSLDYLVGRPYCNDLGYLTNEQSKIVKSVLRLNNLNFAKAEAYIQCLLDNQN